MKTALFNQRKNPLLRIPLHLFLFAAILLLFFPWKTMAAESASTLQKRLTALETRWGHLQIGGDLSLSAEYFNSHYNKPQSMSLAENSHLYLDAQVDPNFSLYLLLAQESTFGSTNIPFYLDEVALRYRSPQFLSDLGRFRFTLDPLGLIADHSTVPVEGLAFQTGGDSWYMGGYYSRQLSSYFLNDGENFTFGPSGTNTLRSDDEAALRLAFVKPKYMAGITVSSLNNGASRIADREARKIDASVTVSPKRINSIAVDFGFEAQGGNLQAEAAWYPRFDRDGNRTGGAVGWLLSWAKPLPDSAGFTAKAWSFPETFTPYYSVIGASNNSDNLMIGNSSGLIGEYQKNLAKGWDLRTQTGIIYLNNETPFSSDSPDLVFSSRLIKSFSTLTSLEMGFDWGFQPVDSGEARYSRFIIKTTTLF